MHPEPARLKGAVMTTPRRSAVFLCQSWVPFSPCGAVPSPERGLGYDVAAFSLVVAIRLGKAAG
jgi:hypothetical protein